MTLEVIKQLATMEDLAAGQGKITQPRGGANVVLGKIDMPYAVEIEDDLKSLDTTAFKYAFFNNSYYRHSDNDVTGILPFVGPGSWVLDVVSANTVFKINELARFINLKDKGVDMTGATDSTAAIQAVVDSLATTGGGIYSGTGTPLISDTIKVANDNIYIVGDGEGTVQGGIATLRASAASRWIWDSSAPAKPMVEFTSVEGEVPKSGGGFARIMLDCNSTASAALVISSWRKGYFGNLHIYAPTSQGIHIRAFAGTLTSEPYDSQQNHLNNIEIHSKNAANAYIGLLMTGGEGDGGANAGNSSFNYITNCFIKSELGTAIRLENTDNNYFYQVHGGGSASFFSLVLETNEGTTGNARYNQFHGCELTGKGVNAKAAQAGGLSSFRNAFFGLSKSNGAPKPTVGTGNGGSLDATIIIDGNEDFTFTPTVAGSSTVGTATYATQEGKLTREGDRIDFEIVIDYSAFTGTGNILIKGLLFQAKAAPSVGTFSIVAENLTFSGQLVARGIANSTDIELVTISSGSAAASVPVDATGKLTISGSYRTQEV